MNLEKGDPENLLGKLWLYSYSGSKGFYYTDRPETIVGEIGGVLGVDPSLKIIDEVKDFGGENTEYRLQLYCIGVQLDNDTGRRILDSDTDVVNLDRVSGLSLEKKVEREVNDYMSRYFNQRNRVNSEVAVKKEPEYSSKAFMCLFITYFGALEMDDSYTFGIAGEQLKNYSKGKRFSKDAENIFSIANSSLGKAERLEGVGLYASFIDSYMKEDYLFAADLKKKIEGWKRKVNLS